MPYELSYNDLPDNIEHWQGLPLSLNDDEVMPLDYQAGKTGWLLYGPHLKKKQLNDFQSKLGQSIVIVSAWRVKQYQVVRIAGLLPRKAKKIADEMEMDVASVGAHPSLKHPGLLIMDMDSTAISIESLDEVAKLIGVGEQISDITEKTMQGSLDFAASLRKRVMLLKGTDVTVLEAIKDNIPLTPGLTHLVKQLKNMGWYLAIASGGMLFFAEALQKKLHIHYVCANQFGIKNNKLTGRLIGDMIDSKAKANFLIHLSQKLNIPINQTVAIGDGANDLAILKAAGLGIAFHAKPKVVKSADVAIRHADLTGVLCILSATLSHKHR